MTTSLELSKQLYEKGLKIETEKLYAFNKNENIIIRRYGEPTNILEKLSCPISFSPVYSTDELLAVMPPIVLVKGYIFSLKLIKEETQYCAIYETDKKDNCLNCAFTYGESPTEALGKICLWLLDNGYHYDEEKRLLIREGR
jgi:hypothetical protein